jgi:hypothetical protein
MALIDRVFDSLDRHYSQTGRSQLFRQLKPLVSSHADAASRSAVAGEVGMTGGISALRSTAFAPASPPDSVRRWRRPSRTEAKRPSRRRYGLSARCSDLDPGILPEAL